LIVAIIVFALVGDALVAAGVAVRWLLGRTA
jgi:hypothetical protein